MQTIRFYTDSGRYMGWEKYRPELRTKYENWIRSGNTFKIKLFNGNIVDHRFFARTYELFKKGDVRIENEQNSTSISN